MESLDFRELADLLNNTRTTHFDLSPARTREGAWALYRAAHRIHTAEYPFNVLYIHARATLKDLEEAARYVGDDPETHVVFAPSLRHKPGVLREYFPGTKGVWNSQEYLRSYITDELQAYLSKIGPNPPAYYIDPPVLTPSGFKFRFPNPLLDLLINRDSVAGIPQGALGILLAEPGQGKTYMSRNLVSEIARIRPRMVPLLIESAQWDTMPVEDQRSLWKTIVHTFRFHGAPIPWLEGHEIEFLRALMKAELFQIVFDGFDEYILRNKGKVQPTEVLDSLAELASETGARIVITSRTSFWDTNVSEAYITDFLGRTGSFVYRILPFTREHAENYFKRRFSAVTQITRATTVFSSLHESSPELVGRGFVLSLVADLIERVRGSYNVTPQRGAGLMWLMHALCEREVLRQGIPLTATQQLDAFRTLAAEYAMGEALSTEMLEVVMGIVNSELDAERLAQLVEKLKSHPLIEVDSRTGEWKFKQEQIAYVLLADQIVRWTTDELRMFVSKAMLSGAQRQDLSQMVVGILRTAYEEENSVSKLRELIRVIADAATTADGMHLAQTEPGRLAAVMCLIALESYRPQGNARVDRTEMLIQLAGVPIRGLYFSGAIVGFDLKGIVFDQCRFDRVTWANCTFDEATSFRNCFFHNGGASAKSSGLGSATLTECVLDEDSSAFFNSVRVTEGKKKYTLDDLRADMQGVLAKFIIKGGMGLKTIDASGLSKGLISASKYRDEILDVLCSTVLTEHAISGPASRGYHIREDAVEAVKFYANNNVFTGPLREAFDRLQRKLGL